MESGDRVEECRFSASGRTVNNHVFFRINFQIGFLKCAHLIRLSLVVDDAKAIDGDDGLGHRDSSRFEIEDSHLLYHSLIFLMRGILEAVLRDG